MATVNEILKASGFTDEQIAALDARAITAFNGVLTTADQASQAGKTAQEEAVRLAAVAADSKKQADIAAQQATAAREAAELAQRSNVEFYETKIIPGLTGWEEDQRKLQSEKANAEALAAFYKAQNESARTAGFVPAEAPVFTPSAVTVPNRDNNGRYVPSAPGATPGSPTFTVDDVRNGLGREIGTISDIQWKHQQLYGKPMPIAPTELVRQAEAMKLDPTAYAARTFNFAQREQEIAQQAKEAHESSIRAEEAAKQKADYDQKLKAQQDEWAAKERKFAESAGNNPDVRTPPGSSKFAEVQKAVREGVRPDPLKMSDADRRAATRNAIHSEIADRDASAA